MALLKKLKGSSLMETMVATVLIVVIFMVASLILNNIFLGYANGNTREVDNRVRVLEYQVLNKQVKVPYTEEFDRWEIEVTKKPRGKDSLLSISVKNINTNKTFIKERVLE